MPLHNLLKLLRLSRQHDLSCTVFRACLHNGLCMDGWFLQERQRRKDLILLTDARLILKRRQHTYQPPGQLGPQYGQALTVEVLFGAGLEQDRALGRELFVGVVE